MLEASADNILQQDFMKAIKQGLKECMIIIREIRTLQASIGKQKRTMQPSSPVEEDIITAIKR